MWAVISAVTSPLYSLRGWSNSLITGALITLLLSWKASTILNHYNLPTFFSSPNRWAVTPRPCLRKQEINSLTLCTSGSSLAARLPGVCIQSACRNTSAHSKFLRFLCLSVRRSERLLGFLLHEHLAGVCAICAFSQQVITNCSLTSHSVQLYSPCWCGQGQLSEGAGWKQLDSTHFGVKGRAPESPRQKLQWGENIWRKTPASSPK